MATTNTTTTTTTTGDSVAATLTFLRSALHYDIANALWLEGEVSSDATSAPQQRQYIQDALEGQNADIVTRALDSAHAAVLSLLAPFIKEAVADGAALDDALRTKEEYVVPLSLPSTFPRAALLALKTAIHDYLVDYALYDWTGRTVPSRQEIYTQRLVADEAAIEDARCRRTGTVRRALHPFP